MRMREKLAALEASTTRALCLPFLDTADEEHMILIAPNIPQAARGQKGAATGIVPEATGPQAEAAAKQPTAVYTPTGEVVSILKVHHDRDPVCFTVVMSNGETREATRETLKPIRQQEKSRKSDPTKEKAKRESSHSKKSKETSSRGDSQLLKKALRHQQASVAEEPPTKQSPAPRAEVSIASVNDVERLSREEDPPFVKAFLKEVDEAREVASSTDGAQSDAPAAEAKPAVTHATLDEEHTTPVLRPVTAPVEPSMLPGSKESIGERLQSAPGTPVQSIQGLFRGRQV